MSIKAFLFRLYPNNTQKSDFARHFGCARLVYNKYIEAAEAQYKDKKTFTATTRNDRRHKLGDNVM